MRLVTALGVRPGDIVAFVGAGGKSSAVIQAYRELREAGSTVLVSPTTKMLLREVEQIGPVIVSEDPEELRAQVEKALAAHKAVTAGKDLLSKERLGGVEPAWVSSLAHAADVVLVEADGSRRRPIKGTAKHEPVLPEGVTLVVAVGGIWALGKPLDEEYVHRPEIFSELTGVGAGHTITPVAFARALVNGSLHNAPATARRTVLLTGVEPGPRMEDASAVAHELWNLGVQKVAAGSILADRPSRVWVL